MSVHTVFWKRTLLVCLLLLFAGVVTGCDTAPYGSGAVTISELLQTPDEFLGRDFAVVGVYLDITQQNGNPHLTLLVPGLDTGSGKDTAPIYAGESKSGGPVTGAVWLDGSLQSADSTLRHSADAVWGVVDVTGSLEKGSFGPGGKYVYRLVISDIRPLQQPEWEPAISLERKSLGGGAVSLFDLADHPADYGGKTVTTQGYYFWSPLTSGFLVERIDRERGEVVRSVTTGTNPRPGGRVIVLEGFPPELSSKLVVGPESAYVWGLVQVTGALEAGGSWGPSGLYHQRLTVTNGQVEVLGK